MKNPKNPVYEHSCMGKRSVIKMSFTASKKSSIPTSVTKYGDWETFKFMLAINEKQKSQVNSQPRIYIETLTLILDCFQNLILEVSG